MKNLIIIIICYLLDIFSFSKKFGLNNIKIVLLKTLGMKIQKPSFIDLGFRVLYPHNVIIGKECSFGHYNKIWAFNKVEIGDRVQSAIGLTIISGSHKVCSLEPIIEKQNVRIEGENWIGANVTIIGGVTVGKGAIIAAGSVVTKNIPPYTVAGGVPARVIKERIPSNLVCGAFGNYTPDYYNIYDEEDN